MRIDEQKHIIVLDRANICSYSAQIEATKMDIQRIPLSNHVPGRIRRVPIMVWPGFWHWGIEGWKLDQTGQPIMWHSIKGSAVRSTAYAEFSGGQLSEVLWTPSTYQHQVSVLARIRSIQGLPWNLTTANCEHVVRWAVQGNARSQQVEIAVVTGLFAGILILLATGSRA
jgi:hypothetical protein